MLTGTSVSAAAQETAPAASFSSISSLSFRRNVMMQSINAFLNRPKQPPNSRNPSDAATAISETSNSQTSKEVIFQEKDFGISPVSSMTSKPTDLEKAASESSASNPKEGETAPAGRYDPFAGGVKGGIKYKSMKWWHASLGMVAETISLGILGLAATLQILGLVPGLIVLLVVGAMASYAGVLIGRFKKAHPHVHSMGDAGEILFRAWGRELAGAGATAFIVFIMGAHLLAGGHTLNVLINNKGCTAIYVFVIAIISFLCTLPRTLKQTTIFALISFASVIAAIIIVMVDVGTRRPGMEVVDGEKPYEFTLWGDPNSGFTKKLEAVTKIMFAFAGHVAFFTFMSELEDPEDFNKALACLQIADITMYAVSAVVMYYFGGKHIKSPALDSASPHMLKVCWGVALGTVVIAGVINGHIAIKYLYVRVLRGNKEDVMHQNSVKAWGWWAGIGAGFWITAYVLAELIPIFDDMVSLTGALFASWFTFGLPGMFWCQLHLKVVKTGNYSFWFVWKKKPTWTTKVALAVSMLFIAAALCTCVVGLYASVLSIKKSASSDTAKPFSCKDPTSCSR